jgi:hypothetical protein
MANLMHPNLTEYQYSSLRFQYSVRFLKLLPGAGSRIHGEVFEEDIFSCSPFVALSYAWGSSIKSKTIFCNGQHFLSVTANLFDALWHIRHPVEAKVIWVDAICIDQSNIKERNHQVAQMGTHLRDLSDVRSVLMF